jgi:hypothetical protein
LPLDTFSSGFLWNNEKDFLRRIIDLSCTTIEPIVKNQSKKPILSIFRPKSLERYRQSQRTHCMKCWGMAIYPVFAQESNAIIQSAYSYMINSLQPIENSIKNARRNLTDLEEKGNRAKKQIMTKTDYYSEIQSKLNQLLIQLSQLGDKHGTQSTRRHQPA